MNAILAYKFNYLIELPMDSGIMLLHLPPSEFMSSTSRNIKMEDSKFYYLELSMD